MPIRLTHICTDSRPQADTYVDMTRIGWVNEETGEQGKITPLAIMEWVENRNGLAYVKDGKGRKAKVIVAKQDGNRFLKTDTGLILDKVGLNSLIWSKC